MPSPYDPGPPRNAEEEEVAFRGFITQLLQAQQYEFLEEQKLFSWETLFTTMGLLCDIIAREVRADSCTIHLKLYDPRALLSAKLDPTRPPNDTQIWDEGLTEHIDQIARRHGMSLGSPEAQTLAKSRWRSAASTLAYPYWKHTKGAARLVATNTGGPWQFLCRSEDVTVQHLGFVTLDRGITSDIVQDNLAKIRDPLSIRSSRSLRKLGVVDDQVWKNGFRPSGDVASPARAWRESFKNYYGTPIRIHAGGEVIGILKVENKRQAEKPEDELPPKVLSIPINELLRPKEDGLSVFEAAILEMAGDIAPLSSFFRAPSLLALAYLSADLASLEPDERTKTLQDVVIVPHPSHGSRAIASTSTLGSVVQLTAGSLHDEMRLWQTLSSSEDTREMYKSVRGFYEAIAAVFAPLNCADVDDLQNEIPETLALSLPGVNRSVTVETFIGEPHRDLADNITLRHFHYRLQLKDATGEPLCLYAMAPPRDADAAEISSELFAAECRRCASAIASAYQDLARSGKTESPGFTVRRIGEWVSLERKVDGTRHQHVVIDLCVDRWAARIEALNLCIPVPEFTSDDTKKLCWAALEIGKLVEREISYRANRSDDPIPLTAMEFYRIPISDLSFVDGLRARRAEAKRVKVHVDHHVKNTLLVMQMDDTVRFGSRVKENRSYLGRLGERHVGFVRGNLAIWFYLLALACRGRTSHDLDCRKFLKALERFQRNLFTFLEQADLDLNVELRAKDALIILEAYAPQLETIVADTRFTSPPFSSFSQVAPGRLQTRIVANLLNERMLDLGEPADSRPLDMARQSDREALESLVFRNFDQYAIAAASLLCQLVNHHEMADPESRDEYSAFYVACFSLRNLLAKSPRDIEDTPAFEPLRKVFERKKPPTSASRNFDDDYAGTWDQLVAYVERNDTDMFAEAIGLQQRRLHLTAPGIYKRIRNLNHTLWQQRDTAHLDWELGRFDLLGCRLNCLFKSQVFAVYEQLWNRGDPFFGTATERTGRQRLAHADFYDDTKQQWQRQRWFCVRTNYFRGDDYHALQIAGLVDPRAIRPGFWDDDGYNLKRVRALMGRCFEELDWESSQQYKTLARTRHHLRWEYTDWFEIASEVMRSKALPQGSNREGALEFGSFLGEAAVDYVLERLDYYFRQKAIAGEPVPSAVTQASDRLRRAIAVLWEPLKKVLECGGRYTDWLEQAITKLPMDQLPFDITLSSGGGPTFDIEEFKKATIALYDGLSRECSRPEGERWLSIAVNERDHYMKAFKDDGSIQTHTPLLFVRWDAKRFPDNPYARLTRLVDVDTEGSWKEIYDALSRLRREQREYLFMELSHRQQDGVLHRIQNYALLCTSEELKTADFAGWTSYDLFYYLRSLIPVEFQVRTMLADTMAEQYHGLVYKGSPPKGTDFPRAQMNKVAVQLDDLDKEMEIDFEDYIGRYEPGTGSDPDTEE